MASALEGSADEDFRTEAEAAGIDFDAWTKEIRGMVQAQLDRERREPEATGQRGSKWAASRKPVSRRSCPEPPTAPPVVTRRHAWAPMMITSGVVATSVVPTRSRLQPNKGRRR